MSWPMMFPPNCVPILVREGLSDPEIQTADLAALEQRKHMDERMLQKNIAYRDRLRAWSGLYLTLAFTVLWLLGGAILYKQGWITAAMNGLWLGVGLIFGSAYAVMQYADIESRNPNNFQQWMHVQLPENPVKETSDVTATKLTAAGDLTGGLSSCLGPRCCGTGTKWNPLTATCTPTA